MNLRSTLALAASLLILSGCLQEKGGPPDDTAGEGEPHPESPDSAEPLSFDERWAFDAGHDTTTSIEFEVDASMMLNFTGTITNFVGTNLSIQLPKQCGDLTQDFTAMQTTIMSERRLGTISCFVDRGTHQLRIQTDGTAEGTIRAYLR